MKKYRKVQHNDKAQVINLYSMRGMSMRTIEKITCISKTKVFDILKEAESSDKQIFLCHNLTSTLYKNGRTVKEYAELYRIKNILMRQGIQPTKALATILKIIELCFRIGLEPQALVTCFENFRQLVRLYPEDLETLKSDLENLQTLSNNLDAAMQNCKNLRLAIELRERSVNSSKNSIGKN